jgi:hypothetical protein
MAMKTEPTCLAEFQRENSEFGMLMTTGNCGAKYDRGIHQIRGLLKGLP